jgi:hypothetical protein
VSAPEPVYLQHIPRDVVQELDELWPLVRCGHVAAHKNDGEEVHCEARIIRKRKDRTKAVEREK